MIVLYNNINPIIQIKNPVQSGHTLNNPPYPTEIILKSCCTFGQCAIYPRFILSLNPGAFYISFQSARCWILGMCSILTYQPKPIPSKSIPPPISHHPKIVQNSHTIHKTTSITTSTQPQNIPQPLHTINYQTIIKSIKISRNPKKYTTLTLTHHPFITAIHPKTVP